VNHRPTSFFSGGIGTNTTKSVLGHITPNLCFAFGGICGPQSAFQCVWGTKCRRTILDARVGPVWIPQKTRQHTLHRTCVFCIRWDLRVAYCIPVRPGIETSMHYWSCLGGTGTVSTKSTMGHNTPNVCFCIRWICGSRCAHQCIKGMKCRSPNFDARVGLVWIPQKPRLDTLQ
jgi:hypothetical protein